MKTIVITGPSGSGKTLLSKKLSRLFENSIVIKTDSYYRDDIIIKFLSFFIYDIYDRSISIKNKELIDTISSIYNKDETTIFYNYDFRSKISTKISRNIEHRTEMEYLILEGIFAHRLNLNYDDSLNIFCNETKEICYQRRMKRDELERGRAKKEINKRFSRSWDLYFKHFKKYTNTNKVLNINSNDIQSCKKIINKIKNNN